MIDQSLIDKLEALGGIEKDTPYNYAVRDCIAIIRQHPAAPDVVEALLLAMATMVSPEGKMYHGFDKAYIACKKAIAAMNMGENSTVTDTTDEMAAETPKMPNANSPASNTPSGYSLTDGRPIFGEGSPHDIGEHLEKVCQGEIPVKSMFTDETNLKAQISVNRLEQIETHAEEGHKFGKSTNSVILELINHIHAIEKVRNEWCMEYVKLRDNKPVSVSLESAASKFYANIESNANWKALTVIDREFYRERVRNVLDAAGVPYVD